MESYLISHRINPLTDRWRPLESAFAAVGSQAEAVLTCIDDEQHSGRAKSIDIDYLLADVIPSLLLLSGRLPSSSSLDTSV
jgi:hypothetical protein